MKKAKALRILMFLVLIGATISFSSKKGFDLSKVRMPYDANFIIQNELNLSDVSLFVEYPRYKTENKEFFIFDNVNFGESFSDKYYSPTLLSAYLDETNSEIPAIELKSDDKQGSEKLYNRMLNKFGEPNYYNKNKNFFNALWVVEKTFFLLRQNYTTEIGGKKTISSTLTLIDPNNKIVTDRFLSIEFENYKDYLEYLEKNPNKKEYTYLDFAKKQEPDFFGGDNKYLEEIKNNLPLRE